MRACLARWREQDEYTQQKSCLSGPAFAALPSRNMFSTATVIGLPHAADHGDLWLKHAFESLHRSQLLTPVKQAHWVEFAALWAFV